MLHMPPAGNVLKPTKRVLCRPSWVPTTNRQVLSRLAHPVEIDGRNKRDALCPLFAQRENSAQNRHSVSPARPEQANSQHAAVLGILFSLSRRHGALRPRSGCCAPVRSRRNSRSVSLMINMSRKPIGWRSRSCACRSLRSNELAPPLGGQGLQPDQSKKCRGESMGAK